MLNTGDIVNNKYRIIEKIGSGSYGTVFRVEDNEHPGVYYALKVIVDALLSREHLFNENV